MSDEQDSAEWAQCRAVGMTGNIAHVLMPRLIADGLVDRATWWAMGVDKGDAYVRAKALEWAGRERMTSARALRIMREIEACGSGDYEGTHLAADDVLRLLVAEMGPEGVEIVQMFDGLERFYA